MKIEHFAYQMNDPVEAGDWYCENLGFTIKRGAETPVPVRFLADETGQVMIEIYNNSTVVTPDYAAMDPLLLHLALVCENVAGTTKKLVDAGAMLVSGPEILKTGDELAMLRDPWGLPIQLCKRANPMI
jgi:glyoxylase I family protein